MSDVIELPLPRRNRLRAALLLSTIIIASAVGGAAFDRYVLAPRVDVTHFPSLQSALRSPTDAERHTRRRELSRELGLDAEQEKAMNAILDRKSGEFDRLREEMRPRVDLLVSEVRAEIDKVLTPVQQQRFHQLQARASRDTASRLGQIKK
jgi:Spy/CpxP family protein refolding chaperone